MKLELRGEQAIVVSKLAQLAAAIVKDPYGELPLEYHDADGSVFVGFFSGFKDRFTAKLEAVTEYRPDKKIPGYREVYQHDNIVIGIDRVILRPFQKDPYLPYARIFGKR